MEILAIFDNYGFSKPIEYTLRFLLDALNLPYQIIPLKDLESQNYVVRPTTVLITYGKEKNDLPSFNNCKRIHIFESSLFGNNWLKKESLPRSPLKKIKGLPVLYWAQAPFKKPAKKSKHVIEAKIDIIASIFFMLSRYEEFVLKTKDQYNRFPARASLAYQEKFLDLPIINEYIKLFQGWLQQLGISQKNKKPWGNQDFAVALTHDVDNIKKYRIAEEYKHFLNLVLRSKKPKAALVRLSEWLQIILKKRRDPFDSFDYILKREKKYKARSSFYIMADGKSKFDQMNLSHKKIPSIIKKISNACMEIGLHGSFNSFANLTVLRQEKKKLDQMLQQPSAGVRQHYLRFQAPQTWEIQEKLNFLYDTSLGFADHEGFRAGLCWPFQPFNLKQNREFKIWELPLIIMDNTLYNYRRLQPDQGLQIIKNYIQTIRKHHGVLVLLWHNPVFDNKSYPGWGKVYVETLRYLAGQNAYINTAENIIKQWISHSKIN